MRALALLIGWGDSIVCGDGSASSLPATRFVIGTYKP
jgi:hypothetical protein